MNGTAPHLRTEIAIVGGGLSGGLIALALQRRHPDMRVHLIEAEEKLGGNHRWSWFACDLGRDETALMHGFRKSEWRGYDVRFPSYQRRLGSRYFSLTSRDFDAALRRELGEDTILTKRAVAALDAGGVTLMGGTRISARTVIDCRGPHASAQLTGGWQVFMGRRTRTARPHGIERPIIMDASVEQCSPGSDQGAYRFIYVLPLGADELFVEDTYYTNTAELDRNALSRRLDRYHARHGWEGQILGGETGILPVVTGGDFGAYQRDQRIPGVCLAGVRGGFAHPLTSYSLPSAAAVALAVADNAQLPGEQLSVYLESRARQYWARTKFYRRLGKMLFGAAKPRERYRVFAHFYRLNEDLIERFYAGQSTFTDKARILAGKPPVSVFRAISALAGSGTALAARKEKIG